MKDHINTQCSSRLIHAMREILNQNKSEHSDVTIQTTITATVGKDRDRVRITVDNKAEQIEKDRARRFERDWSGKTEYIRTKMKEANRKPAFEDEGWPKSKKDSA